MSVRCSVGGKVQGVWYRASAAERAKGLGLSGYVRNRRDGSVELVLAGPATAVTDMIGWLWEGPPGAVVNSVAVETCDEEPAAGFEVTATL